MDRQRPLAYRLVQDRYPSIVLDKTIKEKNEHVDERNAVQRTLKNLQLIPSIYTLVFLRARQQREPT